MPDEPRDPSSLSKPELFLAVGSKIAGIFSVVGFVVAAAGSNAPSEADFLGYAGASGVGAFLGMSVSAICVIGVAALLGRTEALEASDDSEYTIKHGAEINAIGGCLGALVAIAFVGDEVHDDLLRLIGACVLVVCAYYLLFRRWLIS